MGKLVKKIVKPLGKAINHLPGGQYLVDAALLATGNPEFIPLISGASTTAKTNSLGAGLGAAAGSYLGSQLGGAFGSNLGTIGGAANNALGTEAYQALGDTLGGSLGSTASNAFGNIAGASLGSALGGFAGNTIGADLGMSLGGGSPQAATKLASFSPSRQDEQGVPASLQGIGSLNPLQQATNVANQGVYGGGLGPSEQSYFTNLVNRQLVDQSGQVNDISSLPSIESSYLQQLGLGGYSNSKDLLEALSKWKAA